VHVVVLQVEVLGIRGLPEGDLGRPPHVAGHHAPPDEVHQVGDEEGVERLGAGVPERGRGE
jgi:hypothetical protein